MLNPINSRACKNEIQKLAEAKCIKDKIIFTGYREDMIDIYDSLDLLVVASLGESFGITIIEAMARGIPVVSTNCGGPSDIIEDKINGFLVPPKNSKKMAEAIIECLTNKKLIGKCKKNGKEVSRQKFSCKTMIDRYEKAYLSLLNS